MSEADFKSEKKIRVNIFLTLRIENNFLNETKYTVPKKKQMLTNLINNYSPLQLFLSKS